MRAGFITRSVFVVLLTAVLAVIGLARSEEDSRARSRLLVIGHRGNPEAAPENTLASIRAALDVGADLIEVDVRLSRDGVPVIFHDEQLERTTNGRGMLADMTLKELKALDAGSWKNPQFAGERIPTLEEALRAVKGRGRLLLDVPVDQMGARIRAALTASGVPVSQAVLGTWSQEQRSEFHREMPAATIYLSEGVPDRWNAEFFDYHRARGVNAFEIANWSPAFIRDAHTHKFPVYVYTINDEPTMRALIAAGADGIETDLPRLAIAIAKQSGVRF